MTHLPRSEAGRIAWRSYFDSADHRKSWEGWHGFGEVVDCTGHDKGDGFLCAACTNQLSVLLAHIPALVFEVNMALLRETNFVERGAALHDVSEEETSPLPYNPAASNALADLSRALGFKGRVPLHVMAVRARALDADLGPVLRNPEAARWAHRLSLAVAHAQRVIERPADVWYLGPCPQCRADLYAERDADAVVCGCGWQATREDHQHAALDQANEVWLTVGELVGAITQAGEAVSRDQINNWIKREGLVREKRSRPIWRNGKLLPRTVYVYRLGDVRAMAQRAERKRSA